MIRDNISFNEEYWKKATNISERAPYLASNLGESENDDEQIRWWIDNYFGESREAFSEHLGAYGLAESSLLTARNTEIILDKECAWKDNEVAKEISLQNTNDMSSFSLAIYNLCGVAFIKAIQKVEDVLSLDINDMINSENILSEFNIYLFQRVEPFFLSVLALEVNLVRLKSAEMGEKARKNRLEKFFNEEVKTEVYKQKFWAKYPVLWRMVHTLVDNSTQNCCECLRRIIEDRKEISSEFDIHEAVKLQSISWGKGDSHKKGRVVAVLNFETKSLVYKPKPLGLDKAYNDFISWVASVSSEQNAPRAYRILDKKSYGYCEFLKAGSFNTKNEVEAYYQQLGCLMAIIWLLDITDIHLENLIAGQKSPYLIDVETMLNGTSASLTQEHPYAFLCRKAQKDLLIESGILPARKKGSKGIYDASALGASEDQQSLQKGKCIENEGQDDMKIVYKEGIMPMAQNLPLLNGKVQKPYLYEKEILSGFEKTMKILAENKENLLSAESPLNKLKSRIIRFVPRDTETYARVLHSLAHPAVLDDGVSCDLLMAGDLRQRAEYVPFIKPLILSELEDLWNGDIPFFWSKTDSRDLFDSKERPYRDFFKSSGLEELSQRLRTVADNINAQKEYIRLSLRSTAPINKEQDSFVYPQKTSIKKISNDELIALSSKIGDELISKAHYVDSMPFWSGLGPLDTEEYKSSLLMPTLYEGSSGIGLFFAYLYNLTGDNRYKSIAQDTQRLTKLVLLDKNSYLPSGSFSGLGGLFYSDYHISNALSGTYQEDSSFFARWKKEAEKDNAYDIISGAAGALVIVSRYFQKTGSKEAKELAEIAAARLIEKADEEENIATWDILSSEKYPKKLGGMAHGVSGVAWALSLWHQVSGDNSVLPIIQKAFNYEQTFFNPELKTWNDARGDTFSCHWCYGAPGIGIALNEIKHSLPNDNCEELISYARKATFQYGRSIGHGLCHGNLGNSDLFLLSGDKESAEKILSFVLDDYKIQEHWVCDIPGQPAIPGLMCGLAGIGYMLLRHAFPEKVPSVLALEAPIKLD